MKKRVSITKASTYDIIDHAFDSETALLLLSGSTSQQRRGKENHSKPASNHTTTAEPHYLPMALPLTRDPNSVLPTPPSIFYPTDVGNRGTFYENPSPNVSTL